MSKQNHEQAKKVYERLKKDGKGVLFSKDILTNKLLQKLKK